MCVCDYASGRVYVRVRARAVEACVRVCACMVFVCVCVSVSARQSLNGSVTVYGGVRVQFAVRVVAEYGGVANADVIIAELLLQQALAVHIPTVCAVAANVVRCPLLK